MHKKKVGSDDSVLGRIIRTYGAAARAWRRRGGSGEETTGEKRRGRGGESGGAHHEPIPGVDLGGEGPEARIDVRGRSSMVLQWRPTVVWAEIRRRRGSLAVMEGRISTRGPGATCRWLGRGLETTEKRRRREQGDGGARRGLRPRRSRAAWEAGVV